MSNRGDAAKLLEDGKGLLWGELFDAPNGNKTKTTKDVFERLGVPMRRAQLTDLRLRELEASMAKRRELEAKTRGVTLRRFHLVIKDTGVDSFAWEAWFDPPLEPDNAEAPCSAGEAVALQVATTFFDLLDKAVTDGQTEKNDNVDTL